MPARALRVDSPGAATHSVDSVTIGMKTPGSGLAQQN
jgi:hypothetical protein